MLKNNVYHFPYEKVTQEVSLFFSGTKKRNTSKIQFDEKKKTNKNKQRVKSLLVEMPL